jgi:FMN phosphatase YigB (HAD superfamily)
VIEAILFDLDETLHSREQAFWRWIADGIRDAGGPTVDRTDVEHLDARGRGEKRPLLQLLDQTFHWGLSEAAASKGFAPESPNTWRSTCACETCFIGWEKLIGSDS